MIIAQERFIAIIKEAGLPSDRFSELMEAMARQVNLSTILTGSGSPEGVIPADPTQLYMDTSGGAGTILYIKQTGTGDTGWVLV